MGTMPFYKTEQRENTATSHRLISLSNASTSCFRAHLLADARIASQDVGILHDRQLGGSGLADLQHTTPLGEVSAVLLILGAAFRQAVQPCTRKNGIISSDVIDRGG